MEGLFSGVSGQVMALAAIGGLALGFLIPKLAVAAGLALFLAIIGTFVLASMAGTPVPMMAWMVGVLVSILAAAVGSWVRSAAGR